MFCELKGLLLLLLVLLLQPTSLVLSVHSGASNVMLALRSVGLCTRLKPATYIQLASVRL